MLASPLHLLANHTSPHAAHEPRADTQQASINKKQAHLHLTIGMVASSAASAESCPLLLAAFMRAMRSCSWVVSQMTTCDGVAVKDGMM